MLLSLAVLGLCSCLGFSLVAASLGYSLAAVHKLIAVASCAAEHRLQGVRLQQLQCVGSGAAAPVFQSTGSVVVAHGLRCSMACGIVPDQGLNSSLLHRQVNSLPLSHQGSPQAHFKFSFSTLVSGERGQDQEAREVLRNSPGSAIKSCGAFGKHLSFPGTASASQKCPAARSVMSKSLGPHGLQPARLPCLWNFPGKSIGVACYREVN